ncbi:MAG: heavy metal-binding domain-containing protein [Firmicutes bacterium]|nr:heavy metal-binding domain-containing protein [Alicyclobacillaceae bacterium]MCL6498102.1 heavy metal-binding domain-containing protein [Bacillota bacterium]
MEEGATAGQTLEGRTTEGVPVFTCDWSVDELVLMADAGFDPLGLVMGTAVFHLGSGGGHGRTQPEVAALSQVLRTARERALARMQAEAMALGADGVVGVQVTVRHGEWGEQVAEFWAGGTAVRARAPGPWRMADETPFTAGFLGQAFWMLVRAGWRPLRVVMGNCVMHRHLPGLLQTLRQVGHQVEVEELTQEVIQGREVAIGRMQAAAAALGASGVVEVRVAEDHHRWGAHLVEWFAMGTAVQRLQESALPTPQLFLALDTRGGAS